MLMAGSLPQLLLANQHSMPYNLEHSLLSAADCLVVFNSIKGSETSLEQSLQCSVNA